MVSYDLSVEEIRRYNRHLLLPEFSNEGQLKLKNARVLVVGAGGLGCPALIYLAAAGVGNLGIVDSDTVELSNLQRQVLYTTHDVGLPKATIAAKRLLDLNPTIKVRPYHSKLSSSNALDIFADFDIICDGTDNFPTRYLINDSCVLLGKTMVYGAIYRFEGQVSVFNLKDEHGNYSPNYRDLFPEPPSPSSVPNCAESGVLGVLPGIIGNIQASEVIKIITGIGNPLAGKLFTIDLLTLESRTMKFPKNAHLPPITGLVDYEEFCNVNISRTAADTDITARDLKNLMAKGHSIQIIDVREPQEFYISNLGGVNIPLKEIKNRTNEVPSDGQVIVICRSGQRSATAVKLLAELGYKNACSLRGGLLEWSSSIDPDFVI